MDEVDRSGELILTYWERVYLEASIGRPYVEIPPGSISANLLIGRGLIVPFGMVSGKYARFNLTEAGKNEVSHLKSKTDKSPSQP